MGDRKQPTQAPHEFHADSDGQCCEQERGHPVHQRRPPPPPAPPPPQHGAHHDGVPPAAPHVPHGFVLGDRVSVSALLFPQAGELFMPAMSVAGFRQVNAVRYALCTWTEADGQAYHEWIPEGSLELHRGPVPVASTAVALRHVRCGKEVSIACLRDDVALYVWCEACRDLVEEGELFPPVDEAQVRLRVDRERVRPVHQGDKQTTETREVAGADPLSDATDGRM